MEQVISEIKERFQLLTRLRVAVKDCPGETEPVPLFLGILLAAMDSPTRAPACFILPRREKIAQLSAILFGLTKFIGDYNRLDRQIAETNFVPGQNVFVRPPNKVYRYRGVHKDNPAWIELGIIGKTDWQTFPISDIRRLEATEDASPAGKLAAIPRTVPQAAFDQVLDIDSSGNFKALVNHVLVLDHKSDFIEVVNGIILQKSAPIANIPALGELLPLGSISQSDEGGNPRLTKWNFPHLTCDPLVAVTSSQEKMVAACRAAEAHSKVVVVNGLSLLSSHLQAYDEIAETQRLVIIAEHDEQEQMQALADRGCRFWWLGQREISMGIASGAKGETTARVFGPVFRSARNEARMEVESQVCEDRILNEIAVQLASIDEAVKADQSGTTRNIVSRSYKLLNDVASLFGPPTKHESDRFAAQLSAIRRELERDRHWIGSPAATITDICGSFDTLFSTSYRLGDTKGELLLRTFRAMGETPGQRVAILARNNSQLLQLENWSRRFAFSARVFTSSTVPEHGSFDCVVCTAWPGGDAFQRLARRFLAPRIIVIGYAFESNWLKQSHRRLRQRPHLPGFSLAEKSELLKYGNAAHIAWPEEAEKGEAETSPPAPAFSIWEFEKRIRSVRKGKAVLPVAAEETIAAKYVGFRGASYAYITEGHRLPIVTELLTAQEGRRQKTPLKEVEQVRVGDFAVFRDGGNRDVIQVIADRQLQSNGQDAHTLRKQANLWVEALRGTGLTARQILAQLSRFGPGKNLLTIRNWLCSDSNIGPGLRTDLDSIAKITGAQDLEHSKDAVWAAIKRIRGAHLSAGTWLTGVLLQKLPSCLGEIEENGTKINIEDVVTAWVVQVEDISPQFEQYPRSLVNRLLWEPSPDATDLLP